MTWKGGHSVMWVMWEGGEGESVVLGVGKGERELWVDRN